MRPVSGGKGDRAWRPPLSSSDDRLMVCARTLRPWAATRCLTRALSALQPMAFSWLLTRETSPCASARW